MKNNRPAARLHATDDAVPTHIAADDSQFDLFVRASAAADLALAALAGGFNERHLGILSAAAIAPSAPAAGARVEVVFIEQNVADLDGMLKAIGGGREVHLLDASHDGLQQMAQILAGRSGIDAIHLISHGADASLSLGSLTLSADNTDAHAADLQTIGRSVKDGGDIMLYGCDVAASVDGAAWMERLAIVTGADVAASSNLTGSAELGGDWTLEVSSGKIDTLSVVAPDRADLYHSVLSIAIGNVTFVNSANFNSFGGYNASGDVIYNVNANSAYQLKIDGANQGVAFYGGANIIANYQSGTETGVTMSFQAGQLFSIGNIGLTNLGNTIGDQNLVFRGYDASNHLVATNNYTLLADSSGAVQRTFTFTGMTEIATLKVTATTYGSSIQQLQINSLALSNIHTAVADTTPPPAPSTPALASGSDTGTSTTDNLTKTSTPTFQGTAEASATVKLYDGATLVATTTANGSGNWSVATSALSQGVRSITATATDAAGNLGPASSALSVTIDTSAPTLAITSSASTLKSGETATITFTFSEDPGSTFTWNGSAGDVTVSGGTLGAISGTGLTRTATFTPTASTNGGSASISVAASTYTDAAGNNGGAGSALTISYDTLAPSVSTPALSSGSDSGVSPSDAITTVLAPTLTGTAEAGATVRLYESDGTTLLGTAVATGGTWTITTGTLAAGTHSFKATATDAAGNVSALSSGLAVTIDTTAPTVAITSNVSTLNAGETATITFTFSEDPGTTFTWNGSAGDVAVAGGTLGAISGTGLTRSATFTPTASTNAGSASISVGAGAYTDAAGNNGGAGSALTISYDTLAPTVSAPVLDSASDSGISTSDGLTKITTPTLTGTAEAGATVKLYDTDGTTLLGTTVATGGVWTITSATLGAGVHTLKATATDAAGNVSALSSGLAVTIDTSAPTVAITSNVSTLKIGETATITFTFSEDPGTGFSWNGSSGSVTVSGGTLGAISGSGLTRTATFTPINGVDAGSASILVAASAYTDKAGNAGGAGSPVTLSYDTLAPAAPSTPDLADASDSGISNSDNITNITTPTFTGSAPAGATVTLYDTDGTTVLGSAVATGGIWTIVSSTLGSGIHQITARTSDAAGNVSTSSAVSVDIATAPPTLAISSSVPTLHAGQTATITFTFSSDPGASFTWDGTTGDVVVTGGTLGAISGSGLTRTAVFTPTPGLNSGSASITVAAGTYTDAVSNSGGAGTSPSISYDTLAPTAPATPALTSGSDNGVSSSDGITSVTTPSVNGMAEANSSVTLYDSNGATVLGTTTADGLGNWNITSSALATGVHSLTVKQTDTAGNVSTASPALSVTVDTVAPTAIALSASTASDASAVAGASLATLSSTDTHAVSYSLVAGSAGNDASNALFSIVGNTLKPIANLALGSYQLYISATDAAGNHAEQAFTFTVNSGPSVSAIVRADSVATLVAASATALTYTVTFSEAVSGVDLTDFSLVATGNASGTIASISGSGAVYTITVNALGGDGTLGLNLNSSGTAIQNGASAAITGGYSGQVLTLDHTAAAAPGGLAMTSATDTGAFNSDGITSNSTPVFTGTAEADALVTLYDSNGTTVLGTASANGSGNWSITSATLTPGSHNLTVKQTDAAGNVSVASAPLPVSVLTAVPTLAITSNLSLLKAGQSATITFTFSADPGASFAWDGSSGDVVVAGGTLSAIAGAGLTRTATFTPTAASNAGAASITAVPGAYSDLAGNIGAGAMLALSYDTLAPAAPSAPDLSAASDNGASNSDNITSITTPTFTGTAEAGATVRLFDTDGVTVLGTAVATGGNWSITTSALGTGQHNITAVATDAAGNASPASSALSVTIEIQTPSASSAPQLAPGSDNGASSSDNLTSIRTPEFIGTAQDGVTVTLVDSDGATLGSTVATGGVWRITSTTLAPGAHSVRALVSDAFGNSAAPSAPLSLTIASGVSTTAVTGIALSSDSGSSNRDFITNVAAQTVSGTLSAPLAADEFVQLSFDNGATWIRAAAVSGAAAWSVAGSLNQGGGTLQVQVGNQFGGTGPLASQAYVLDTQAPLAPAAPSLAAASDSGDSNSDGITNVTTPQVSGRAEAGARVTLFDSDGATVLGTTTAGSDGSWSIVSSALSDGAHALSVRQTDAAGNQSAPGAALQIRVVTGSVAAPSAPVLSAASDSGVAGDGVTTITNPVIQGVAAANALIKLYDGAVLLGTARADGAGAWSVAAPTLASAIHALTVVQSDVAGNVSAPSAALMLSITLPPTTVDGVPVSQAPVPLPGGGTGTAVEVPVILPDRANSSGPTAVADIPLAVTPASGGGTSTLLLAQLPTGLGLSASGGVSAPAGDPLEQLIRAIIASTPNNAPADQTHLTDNGRNYLNKLPGAVPLLVETVKPISGTGANGAATLTLTGTVTDTQHTALVIDASNLAAGNSIVLQSVDFAAVIGAAIVTGKTSGQVMTGDAASQQFTVGIDSASSVFAGGGGDTLVFGLPVLQGGRGSGVLVLGATSGAASAAAAGATADATAEASVTTLHGGQAADTAVFAGAQSDYKVELHDGYIVVSALNAPLAQAMLINIETIKFADATLSVQNRAELGAIAGLYQNVLGRQADVLGFEYWGNLQAKGATLGEIALGIILTAEGAAHHVALNGTAAHDVAILYQSIFGRAADAGGLTFWTDAMQNQQLTLLQVAQGFMQSAEIVGHNQAATAWDFQV